MGLTVVALVMVACSSSKPDTSPPTQAASTTSSACTFVACRLTKDSGVAGVPLPDDATKDADGLYVTQVGTVAEVTAAYKDLLTLAGWTFSPAYSTMTQDEGEAKGLGRVTNATYCKPGPPIVTVFVIVGDAKTGGTHIGLVSNTDETTCP